MRKETVLWRVYEVVHDWQTLTGALVALAAAIITINIMRHQAADERRRYEKQQAREKMAARAQMPDALSAMVAYSRFCGAYLTEQQESLPEIPVEATNKLKQVIEHIDDGAAQRTFELYNAFFRRH